MLSKELEWFCLWKLRRRISRGSVGFWLWGKGIELAAGEDEEHHAVVGVEGDGEEHEEAHEPARSLEAVGKAQDAGPDDGDEDVGEGL